MTARRAKPGRRILRRRGDARCTERELERRLSLLLRPVMPSPQLRRRVLAAVRRDRL
jgi:hypothetical protein